MMLYFRGCTAREKQTGIQDATEKLLNLAGVDYHVLEDESCCGSVLLRTGFIKEGNELIKDNTEVFGDETILTSCAGCFKTFKEDYENINVIHISQLLKRLIDDGKLDFDKGDLNVTYHDSCHLGRHMEIFDDPRSVIESVAGIVEMENNRENSLCCGAGGGVKSAYPEIADELANARISQARDTGCEILVTACPFCKLNLSNDDLEVLDLTEFLVKYGGLDEDK